MIAAWIGEDKVPYVDMFHDGWYAAWDGFGSFKVFCREHFVGEIQDKVFFLPSGEMRLLKSDMFVIQQLITAIEKLEI